MSARIIETNNAPFQRVDMDTVTVDLIENALRNARVEMDAVLFRTAMSPGIREQGDCFPMIANREGKMVVGQFGSFIRGFTEAYDADIEEGDVILTNDPYLCNAAVSHLPDWIVLVPIFKDGRHIAWSAMFGHMSDNGGMVPGSIPIRAETIFQEGIRIPPTKLYKKGELQSDVLELILHNVRTPQWNRFDLNALVAACNTAAKRCIEMAERFGDDVFYSTMEIMLERNYIAMKAIIEMIVPEEPRVFEDYVCDDGVGMGPYKIRCKLWREGPVAIFDFAGTDPQAQSSINFYLNEDMFKMFFGSFTINLVDPQILFNDGFYDLVDVRIPQGSLLKPNYPAALSGRTHALGRIFDVMGGLLGQTMTMASGSSYSRSVLAGFPADRLGMVRTAIPCGRDSPMCQTNLSRLISRCGSSSMKPFPIQAEQDCTEAVMACPSPTDFSWMGQCLFMMNAG
jgi:N-methylhydantoinase B